MLLFVVAQVGQAGTVALVELGLAVLADLNPAGGEGGLALVLGALEVERDHLVGAQVAEVAFALLYAQFFATAVVRVLRFVSRQVTEPRPMLDTDVVQE
jgi:hypothetical protein